MLRPSKHDDLLRAAEACFYDQGIAATGVDLVAERAGVSKRTLYNHYSSKADLVEDTIRTREQRWRERAEEILARDDDPLDVLRTYARFYVTPLEGDNRGCAFVNAAAELADDDPALALIVGSKDAVVVDVQALLERAGHPAPGPTSRAVGLLLEGACVRAGVHRSTDDASGLLDAINLVVAADNIPTSSRRLGRDD